MNAPPPPRHPITGHRLLVVIALVLDAIVAVLVLFGTGTISTFQAVGLIAVSLAVYFASLLVP